MRIDPVPSILLDPPAPVAKDNNSLIAAEVELHRDSGNIPVPAAASVQSETQGSTGDTSPNRGEVAWSDSPRYQVYRIVDPHGNVVFQMPSRQVLNVAEQIDSALKQEDSTRELDVRS